jgi:hypothetical protein
MTPVSNNDASHKEFFDMGCPYETVSKEERKYPLHEKTPFPEGKPEYDEIKRVFDHQY